MLCSLLGLEGQQLDDACVSSAFLFSPNVTVVLSGQSVSLRWTPALGVPLRGLSHPLPRLHCSQEQGVVGPTVVVCAPGSPAGQTPAWEIISNWWG